MRGVNADNFVTPLVIGIFFFAELAGDANGLFLSGNMDPALRLNITRKITLIGGRADVFHPAVKPAAQTLVPDAAAFAPCADGRNANGVKLRDAPCRCPGGDGGGYIGQQASGVKIGFAIERVTINILGHVFRDISRSAAPVQRLAIET